MTHRSRTPLPVHALCMASELISASPSISHLSLFYLGWLVLYRAHALRRFLPLLSVAHHYPSTLLPLIHCGRVLILFMPSRVAGCSGHVGTDSDDSLQFNFNSSRSRARAVAHLASPLTTSSPTTTTTTTHHRQDTAEAGRSSCGRLCGAHRLLACAARRRKSSLQMLRSRLPRSRSRRHKSLPQHHVPRPGCKTRCRGGAVC